MRPGKPGPKAPDHKSADKTHHQHASRALERAYCVHQHLHRAGDKVCEAYQHQSALGKRDHRLAIGKDADQGGGEQHHGNADQHRDRKAVKRAHRHRFLDAPEIFGAEIL